MNNSQQMLQALEEQDLTKAEHYFAKALENDSSDLLYELATYLEGIGFYPQAKEIYLKIVEDFPEVHLNLAAIASEDGQIEEAFTYLEEIQADSDWYVSSLALKADLYQLEGLTDVAREKLLEALTYSEDSLLILGLAELDSELENYQAAIQAYAQLDNRSIYEQTGISTYQRIGFAYAQLGKFETATEFLEKALELEYDDLTALSWPVFILIKKNIKKPPSTLSSLIPFLLTLKAMSMGTVRLYIRNIKFKKPCVSLSKD